MLAGGMIPEFVQDFLSTRLSAVVNNNLAKTEDMPIIGGALKNNPDFITTLMTGLMDDLDTASVTKGDVTGTRGFQSARTS